MDEADLQPLLDAARYEQLRFHELRDVTSQERAIGAALAVRSPVWVRAGDGAALRARGFRAGDCHRNCAAAHANRGSVQVFGWTVAADRYLSHSVLRLPDGGLQCITPDHTDELDADGRFPFVEDADVTCDGDRMFWRGDWLHPFNTIVRRDPEALQARCKMIAEQIRDGAISYEEALATE